MTERDEKAERRVRFIQALRDCADFYEAHPAVDAPGYSTLNVFVNDRDALRKHAQIAAWEKVYNENWFSLRKEFGGEGIDAQLTLEINASRETVCKKVVTGKKVVPAQPEREVDEFTWVCEAESLLAPVGEEVPSGA